MGAGATRWWVFPMEAVATELATAQLRAILGVPAMSGAVSFHRAVREMEAQNVYLGPVRHWPLEQQAYNSRFDREFTDYEWRIL